MIALGQVAVESRQVPSPATPWCVRFAVPPALSRRTLRGSRGVPRFWRQARMPPARRTGVRQPVSPHRYLRSTGVLPLPPNAVASPAGDEVECLDSTFHTRPIQSTGDRALPERTRHHRAYRRDILGDREELLVGSMAIAGTRAHPSRGGRLPPAGDIRTESTRPSPI
jgi:hypothetical protein